MLKNNKPYIFTCINCGENIYSREEKNKHICKKAVHESEKMSLTKELNSIEQRKEVILRKLQILKDKEISSIKDIDEKKKQKKRLRKKKKIDEAETLE